MITSLNSEPVSAPESDGLEPMPSAGRKLREARLNAGMHLAELSVTLKVPVRELEALEADVWDVAKGPVFYRGLASSVCRHLKADPTEILALLPPATGQLEPVRDGLGAGVTPRQFSLGNDPLAKSSTRKVVWIAALMVVLIAALLWLPGPKQWSWLDTLKASLASDVAFVDSTRLDGVTPNSVQDALDNGLTTTDVAIPLIEAPSEGVAADVTPALAAAETLADSSPDASLAASRAVNSQADSNPQSSTAGPEWVFSASDDSWLEVRNAQQAIVWSGIVKSGEAVRIQSPLPVSVVVGRAQAMAVSFRGEPFDLKPHTKVAVARFEVKE